MAEGQRPDGARAGALEALDGGRGRTLGRRTRRVPQEIYNDPDATLDDLREAVNTLEEIEPTARRVLGGAHPLTVEIELHLEKSRAALRARETPSPR